MFLSILVVSVKLVTKLWILLITGIAPIVAAWVADTHCSGFVAGFVYATVITSPYLTGLERFNMTLLPEIPKELMDLVKEFTLTLKHEVAGIMLASVKLYVIPTAEGFTFSTAELKYVRVRADAED